MSPPEVPALDINPIDARQHLRLLAGELDAISNPSLTVEQRLRRRDLAHRILAQLHQHLYPGEK